MKIKAYTLNSFAKNYNGGNPAGVVLDADALTERTMKNIAKFIGFSETAFVMKSNFADFKVRFFTPKEEVDLCGHATIGTYYTLASKQYIRPGFYTQETKAGIFNIKVDESFNILMNQPCPVFYDIIAKNEIASSLGLHIADINETLPIQIVSTGLKDILIPVKDINILNSIKPDFKAITELSQKYNVIGYHVFSEASSTNITAYCRNFAPLYDIPEEAATGTSSGALACYLYKYKKINTKQAQNVIFEQGISMNRPSKISVILKTSGENILEVQVGGSAMNLSQLEINI